MLVVLAGLPATGKSAIAGELARELPAVVLDKDRIRAALFPPPTVEYSQAQDDFCVRVIFETAAFLLAREASRCVVVDGRPFVRGYQVRDLLTFVSEHRMTYRLIECVCSDRVAAARLERDVREGRHAAADRNVELYLALKSTADPLPPPKLVVDTDRELSVCIQECLNYIRGDNR